MSRVLVKDLAELQTIRTRLSSIASLVDSLAVRESRAGTNFNVHKSLNILYKELRAGRIILDCMAGLITKSEVKKTRIVLDIQEPQSWKMFLGQR